MIEQVAKGLSVMGAAVLCLNAGHPGIVFSNKKGRSSEPKVETETAAF